jgi:hypothetical protein
MSSSHTPAHDAEEGASHKAGAFDIRVFIGSLIGIYAIVLLITGLLQSDGRAINLYTGAGMLVGALVFITWARLRPVVVPVHPDEESAPPAQ